MFGRLYEEFGEDILPQPEPENFPENLKFFRLKSGLSKEGIGRLYGKGKNWWGSLENGKREPTKSERFFIERLIHHGEVRKTLLPHL